MDRFLWIGFYGYVFCEIYTFAVLILSNMGNIIGLRTAVGSAINGTSKNLCSTSMLPTLCTHKRSKEPSNQALLKKISKNS